MVTLNRRIHQMTNEPGKYRKEVNRSKGLGDTVSKIIEKITFGKKKSDDCLPCQKKKEALNKRFPYKNDK